VGEVRREKKKKPNLGLCLDLQASNPAFPVLPKLHRFITYKIESADCLNYQLSASEEALISQILFVLTIED
jgi:hypothetical protein